MKIRRKKNLQVTNRWRFVLDGKKVHHKIEGGTLEPRFGEKKFSKPAIWDEGG